MTIRKKIPDEITKDHLIAAIQEIASGKMHGFGRSIDYDLEFRGQRYPPKAVVGIAAKFVLGTPLKPKQFTSGIGSRCFRILENHGFPVVAKEFASLYPDEVDESDRFREGSTKKVVVNRYERDSKARKACVDHYGTNCSCCNIDLGQQYGDLGIGFVHVHHLVPLSEIKQDYVIDPIRDLRPVCPNCHAMLHRTRPPLTIEELCQLISKHE